ncbi:hypothetical protein JQ628_16425 [Bradyrhizobium lablabi]|uniref:hypothetical protein n=1 Tax=Bradyrhizobium lablabi TaxID=722472 RepID=UPI001BA55B3A|nr:hypothetical protein [Bradyrhizobium lablabi]MBR1123114.1 hypothetical protein [Bradyrhizobium lablabi]
MSPLGSERHAGLLRAWHLAVLRFALTRDNADRLGVLAIANEIDRLGHQHQVEPPFSFFRRTSAELCAAMMRQQTANDDILSRYLAQIEDVRLHRALSAALGIPQQEPDSTKKRIKPKHDLWKGLPSRSNLSRL